LRFDDSERADFERRFRARGIHRSVAVVVDSVASIPGFMRGTDLLAIAPSMLAQSLMSELAWAPAPFPLPALDVHMSWHNGNTQDGAHSWLRGLILQSTNLLRTRLAGSG
jgi:DNA-binding transcriptional LysR family regulator